MRYVALIVLLTLLPQVAWADDPLVPVAPLVAVPPGDDTVVVVRKGDVAPFTGQLFDQPTALRWANYLQQCHFRLQADVDYQKKYDAATITLVQKQLDLERTQYTNVTTELQKKLEAAQVQLAAGPPWYQTATFGAVMGVVLTLAAVVGSAVLLNATK